MAHTLVLAEAFAEPTVRSVGLVIAILAVMATAVFVRTSATREVA